MYAHNFMRVTTNLMRCYQQRLYRIMQILVGRNFGKFDKMNVI